MNFESIFNSFLPANLSTEIDKVKLARTQLKFIIIAVLFSSAYFLFSFFKDFIVVEYVTLFSNFFFLGLLLLFKKGIRLKIISHLYVFYFWLVVITVTLFSGGIHSYVLAWIALIPIMAITLLSSRAAWTWGIIGIITVFAFYFIDLSALLPSHLLIIKSNLWNASLHIGLQFFILILSYVFAGQQKELISKIKSQKEEISIQNENYKSNYESVKILSEIGAKITASLSIDSIIGITYESVNNLFSADSFSFALYNEANDSLEFPGIIEKGKKLGNLSYHIIKDSDRLAVECFIKQKVLVISDLKKEYPDYPKALVGQLPTSVIFMPLLKQSIVVGVIGVTSFAKNAFTGYHVHLLKNLATYISIAIENSTTFSRLAKSHENIMLLNKIGQDISSNLSIENIAHSVYQNINTLMSADRFGIGIIDKAKNAIQFKDYSANSDKFKSLEFPLDNTDWLAVHCVLNNMEIVSGDIKNDYSHYVRSNDTKEANMLLLNSIIVLPILINDKVIGCIGVQSKKADAYNDYHVNLLRSLSIDVGIALENAQTFNRLENKSVENKILYELSSNLIKSIELDELLKKIMNAAVELLPNAQSGAVFLLNPESNMLEGKVAHTIPDELIKKVRIKVGEWQSGKAVKEKRSFIDNNVKDDFIVQKKLLENYTKPYRSIIVVLLKVKSKIIGTITVDNHDKYNAFSNKDLEILSSLAANASVAIERVRMYELIESVNSDLMMAYSKLKDLDEYKEAMTAMIVHDFKNSLNTVISFSEGVPTERRLKSIRQAGQFMLNMVLNILDVQKFENAKIKLALGNYPISKVIEEAVNQLSYIIEQKSIKLTYVKEDKLFSRMDYELVTRVLVNILSNAIKYVTINGEIEIFTSSKGECLTVSIKDNGPGISENNVSKVFEKYSQLDAKKSGSVRSTGIGLTFCKMVIEAHKGIIDVESKEGEGSTFYFTLPLIEDLNDLEPELKSSDNNKDQILVFSQKENEYLDPYLKELQKWEVYDYSEVTAIIENIKSKKNKVKLWKEKMIKALQNVNEEEYNQLVKVRVHEEES
jgi:K+-sensing histidine kinase KdpD